MGHLRHGHHTLHRFSGRARSTLHHIGLKRKRKGYEARTTHHRITIRRHRHHVHKRGYHIRVHHHHTHHLAGYRRRY